MSLFSFKKKETEKNCCCFGNCTKENLAEKSAINGNIKSIKVLGAGCKACHTLFENVKSAVENLGLSVEVQYVADVEKIASYGTMTIPVIVIDEKIVSAGKVLKINEIERLIGEQNG